MGATQIISALPWLSPTEHREIVRRVIELESPNGGIGTPGGDRFQSELSMSPEECAGVEAVLAQRFDSGETEVAERHNEHQP